MDGASVFRLMSLIPERGARAQSGTLFVRDGSAKMELLGRFLHWLGPLESLSKEDQQVLGVRAGGGKSLDEADAGGEGDDGGEAGGDDALAADDLDNVPIRLPGAGTQIAA